MKGLGKILVCLVGGLVLSAGLRAQNLASADNPYGPIVARNVFGLNPPAPATAPAPVETPLKITLNGIMSVLGQAQALFKVSPKPGVPNAKEESYVLSEGQGQDDIEVVRINEKGGVVTFNNHGIVQDVPLANAPTIATPAQATGVINGGIPTRFGGNRPGGPGSRSGGPNNGTGGGPALNTIPTRGGGGNPGTTPQAQNTLAPEDQIVMIAAQHLKAQQEGDPIAAIFPPTEVDEEAGIISNVKPAAPSSPKP